MTPAGLWLSHHRRGCLIGEGAFGAREFLAVRLRPVTFCLLITTRFEVMSHYGTPCDKECCVQNHYLTNEVGIVWILANLGCCRINLGPENTKPSKSKKRIKTLEP